MEINLNRKQYSGETFQKISFHITLINPLHPLKGVRGFFICLQPFQIQKNHQEGLNLVHPLEPNLLGIMKHQRERVSATTPNNYNGFQEWNTQPPAFVSNDRGKGRAANFFKAISIRLSNFKSYIYKE